MTSNHSKAERDLLMRAAAIVNHYHPTDPKRVDMVHRFRTDLNKHLSSERKTFFSRLFAKN